MGFIQKFGGAYQGRALLTLAASLLSLHGAAAQEIVPPSSSGQASVRLEAEQQRKEGDIYLPTAKLKSNIEIFDCAPTTCSTTRKHTWSRPAAMCSSMWIRSTSRRIPPISTCKAEQASFEHVRGEVTVEHKPNANVLVSPNPLIFEAQEVRRLDARTYSIEHAWLTVCEPDKPSLEIFHIARHAPRGSHGRHAQRQLPTVPYPAVVFSLCVGARGAQPAEIRILDSGIRGHFGQRSRPRRRILLGAKGLDRSHLSAGPISAGADGSKMGNFAPSPGRTCRFRQNISA